MIGRFSTRTLFFTSVGAFTTGTLLAGFSADFPLILTGRIVQGVGAGLLMPLFQTTILRVFAKEKIGAAMGMVGISLTQPLLDFKLFRYRMFTHSSIIRVILFIIIVGVELLLPLYAQNVRGLTPRESGLMLLPGALLLGVSNVISGRIYDRFGVRLLIQGAFFFRWEEPCLSQL